MSFIASLAAVIGEGALALGAGTAAASVLGGVGAGALTGTALSAGTAALTGGDVGDAAAMGALTGGLTGGLTSGIGLLGSAPETALGAAPGEMFGKGAAGLGTASAAEVNAGTNAASASGAFAPKAGASILAPTEVPSGPFVSSTPQVAGPMSTIPAPTPAMSPVTSMTPVEGVPTGLRNAANWVNRNQALTQGIGSLGANAVLGPMMQDNTIPKPKQYKSPFSYDPNNFTPVTTNPADYMYHPSYAEGGSVHTGGGALGGMLNDVVDPGVLKFIDYTALNSPLGAMMGWENPEDVWLVGQAYKNDTPNTQQPVKTYASGGIASLGYYSDGGQLLKGPGDGVSDDIPASINGGQPARLADGEFVIPARIVSELGNGSTEAGAKRLYDMINRVNAERAKTAKKGAFAKNTKAYKHLPL